MQRQHARTGAHSSGTGQQQGTAPEELQPRGNAAFGEDMGAIADQVPEPLSLEGLGVSFRLPGDTSLTGNWNQLQTTGSTSVWIDISSSQLKVRFSPALLVDAQWPMSNVEWRGLTYDLRSGSLGDVELENTQWLAFGASGFVDGAIREFVDALVQGTPLAAGDYDPLRDPDVAGTLQMLRENATANASKGSGGDLDPSEITEITPSASFETTEEIRQGTDEGGIHVPAGTSLRASVRLAGSAADLGGGGLPGVEAVFLDTEGVVLEKDGEPLARLQQITVRRGGTVEVGRYEPLGSLREAGDVESGLKGLLLLLQLAAMREGQNPGPLVTNLDPNVVDGIATGQMEQALTSSLHGLLEEHHDAVPGVDLRSVLGIPTRG